ncbi:MAG: glycosyltransferase family 39 protein [Phycisphaerales bacterium]|nr:MAG: glycosyltransferase family 39 protein [Phycisphaerales bacterium]
MPEVTESRFRYGAWYALAGFVCIRTLVILTALWSVWGLEPPETAPWWSDVPLVRWDSAYYMEIVREGYRADAEIPHTVAFFPLYPLSARLLTPWLKPDAALVVVSNLAAVLGAVFLYLWARKLAGPRAALGATLLAASYPPAMFLAAGYTEGLFFLEVAVALWLLCRGRDLPAACVSGLATATRPTGLVLAMVVWMCALTRGRPAGRRRRWPRLLAIGLLSISGFLAYQAFLWSRYDRPDAFLVVQKHWPAKEVGHPWVRMLTLQPVLEGSIRPIKYAVRGEFGRLAEPWTWNPLLLLLVLATAAAGLIKPGKVPRLLFLLPIIIFLVGYVPGMGGLSRFNAMARYQVVALPCFLLWANWRPIRNHRVVFVTLIAALVLLQCVFARAFANWQWAG